MNRRRLMQPVDLPVDQIRVGERLRGVDEALVQKLIDSVERLGGLTHRILVGPENILIDGLQRVEMAKILGWETIPAELWTATEIERQLGEIDANLVRKGYRGTALGKALKLQKELYEAINPETRKGASARLQARDAQGQFVPEDGKRHDAAYRKAAFIKVAAKKLGVETRTVERQVQIATAFSEDELGVMDELGVPQMRMIELSRLPEAEKHAGVDRLKEEGLAALPEILGELHGSSNGDKQRRARREQAGLKNGALPTDLSPEDAASPATSGPVKAPRRNQHSAAGNGNGRKHSLHDSPDRPAQERFTNDPRVAGQQVARFFDRPDELGTFVDALLEERPEAAGGVALKVVQRVLVMKKRKAAREMARGLWVAWRPTDAEMEAFFEETYGDLWRTRFSRLLQNEPLARR